MMRTAVHALRQFFQQMWMVRQLYLCVLLPILRHLPRSSISFGPVRRFCPTFQEWIGRQGIGHRNGEPQHAITFVRAPELIEEAKPILAQPWLPQAMRCE